MAIKPNVALMSSWLKAQITLSSLQDICRVIEQLAQLQLSGPPPPTPRVYNMGGPERLSRVEMAQQVNSWPWYLYFYITEGYYVDSQGII